MAHLHSGYHRLICQAVPEASAAVFGALCRCREHRPAVTRLHCSSQQGQTVWHQQKRWERQGTANIKVILVILKGCFIQIPWLLLNSFAREAQMKWGLWRNVQGKDPATFLVLKKVDQTHQTPWKKLCLSQGAINLWYHWESKRC